MNNYNAYAPPAYSGLQQRADSPTVDLAFAYTYDVVLDASEALQDQVVPIQNDADFLWRALYLTAFTGAFKIRMSDSQGTYFSNGYLLHATFLSGDVAVPWPAFPEVLFPKGGRIGIDITDLSAATNTIQILYMGVKRFQLPR